jgi:hypothetical protein
MTKLFTFSSFPLSIERTEVFENENFRSLTGQRPIGKPKQTGQMRPSVIQRGSSHTPWLEPLATSIQPGSSWIISRDVDALSRVEGVEALKSVE